jgi:beta-lactamase class A
MVGVWFRDLDDGPTFGINDREDFVPASLLKLPLVLTYLQIAENDPDVLQRVVVYTGTSVAVPDQTFQPHETIQTGTAYTIDDLIRRSIVYSDNLASQLLYDYLRKNFGDQILSETYRDFGILEPGSDITIAAVNTKGYASIFRMIYNAYITRPF